MSVYSITCQSGQIVCNNACVVPACTSNAQCAAGQVCQNAGTCSAQCVTTDTTAPTSSITSPAAGSWQDNNFAVSVSDSDTGGSGLASCEYQTKDGAEAWSAWRSRTCNAGVTITVGSGAANDCSAQGANLCDVQARARDGAGNTGASAQRDFSVDYTPPPAPTITAPAAGSWQTNDFTVSVADSDALSGVESCEYRTKDGGEAWSSWRGRTCSAGFSVSIGSASSEDCSSQGSNLCGVQARTTDNAGNVGPASQRDFSPDYTAPSTSITSPASGSTQSADFSVSFSDSDAQSGLALCEYRVLSNGVETRGWTARACSGSVTVTIGASGDCRHAGTSTCQVESRATDNAQLQGTAQRAFSIDLGVPPVCGNGVVEAGEQCDTASNGACPASCSAACTANDCTLGDTTPPSTAITSPAAGSWQTTTYSVSFSDSDNVGLARCEYRVLSAGTAVVGWTQRTCSGSVIISSSAGQQCRDQGANQCAIESRATDKAGLQATASRSFSIDWTPPVSAITAPAAGSWHEGAFIVSVSESDTGGSGFARCEWRTQSASRGWGAWKSCGSDFTVAVGASGDCLDEGANMCRVQLRGFDAAGNEGNTDERSFSVDFSAPSVTTSGPTGTIRSTDSVTVTATASDTGSGIASLQIFFDGAVKQTCAAATCSWTGGPQASGSHSYHAVAADTAGNSAQSSAATFTVNSPPIASIGYSGGTDRGLAATLHCRVSDPDQAASTLDTRAWAGECTASNCFATRAWATQSQGDKVYFENSAMSFAAASGNFTSTFTIDQNTGTGLAATCQATDAQGEQSNFADGYPLFTVGGCQNPPIFSEFRIAPSRLATGDVAIAFNVSHDLAANPDVEVPSLGRAAAFVSKLGNRYTYSFSVVQGDASGSHDVLASGADNKGCSGVAFGGSFDIDQSPPATSAACNGGSCGIVFQSAVSVALTCADASGCDVTQYRVDGGAWQTGAGFVVSGNGLHTAEYFSNDTLGNAEAPKSQNIFIDDTLVPGFEARIILDKTSVRRGETVKARFYGRLVGEDGSVERCSPATCSITRFRINNDDLRSFLAYSSASEEWTYDINTYQYASIVDGCVEHSGTGQEDCDTQTFDVNDRIMEITVRFPDMDAGIIPQTQAGEPNFTRPMPLRFVAEAQVVDGTTEKCNASNCAATYRIDGGAWLAAGYDGFSASFAASPDSSALSCDTTHVIDVNVTKTTAPDQGVSALASRSVFLSCTPRVIVSPVERRVVVGARNIEVFMVTVLNPRDAMSYTLEMRSSHPEGFPLQWINFRGYDEGVNSISMDMPAVSSQSAFVDMPEAARAGLFPVTFAATAGGNVYTTTGTILVFSESLPEFAPWQLIPLAIIAFLIVYFDPVGISKARARRK